MPLADELPFAFLHLFKQFESSWPAFQLARFGLLFAVLLVPTTCSGFAFPLAVQAVVRRRGETGRRVGVLYGCNTIGAILGAFVGGFVLIPFIGLQQGLVIGVALNIFTGLALLAVDQASALRTRFGLGGTALCAGLIGMVMLQPWELTYLNSGAYIYAHDYNDVGNLRAALKAYHPVFYREGPTATVAVVRSPRGTLSLTIDGKTDASTGQHADMSTQVLLSHLPALFVDRPRRALLIGLGSGVSLGSLLRYPLEHVDVLEISPAVVEASDFFRDYNHHALDDPRVNLVAGDGRHFLNRSRERYDLIISQPSNPWITGNANLFTREYYHMIASHLAPHGVACQWVPSYHMSKRTLAIIAKTFTHELPNTSLWTSSVVGDLFLIGSPGDLTLDYDLLLRRLGRRPIDDDLARVGMNDPLLLARTFKMDPAGIQRLVAEFGPALPENTDAHPIIEFTSPRYLLTQRVARDFNRRTDLTGDLADLLPLIDFESFRAEQRFEHDARAALDAAPPAPAR